MRHRTAACVLAALIGVGLMWPTEAAAQRRSHTRGVTRAVPATRVVRVRPAYYRYYYPYSYSLYWGWGYPWYSYPYFYGPYGYPGYPYGYGGPWGYRYYDDYASVRVLASPRDAQVYVDGYFVGVVGDFDGGVQRLRVPPGGHEITLHLNGYRNAAEKMSLQPNSTYRLRTRLEPLAAGAPQEPPPAPNPDAVRSAEPGYERRGAQPEPDEPEPQGPPSRRWPPRQQAEERQSTQATENSRFGTLTLRVQPADAEVTIDGTPWHGAAEEDGVLSIQVPAGTHRVEIQREGYVSYVADVNVRASVATPLNVMLQREN